jgi:hypothetical protein
MGLKINRAPRPKRMKRPKPEGRAKRYYKLYIQDELRDVLVDKYGLERGEKTWEYLISQPNNGMYTVGQNTTDEKAQMYFDLGEDPPRDYWKESYFDVWERWMDRPKTASMKEYIMFDEIVNRIVAAESGNRKEYMQYFEKKLEKYNVTSPADLKGDQKKKFYDEVDAGWDAKKETD